MLSSDLDRLPELLVDPALQVYIPTIVLQLLILSLVLLTAKLESGGVNSLGFNRFTLTRVVTGVVFFVGAGIALSLLSILVNLLGFAPLEDPTFLLPRSVSDKILWTILSLVVAFAEEAAFRGYALTRLEAITRNRTVTVIAVSLAFSAGHIYQGVGGLIIIFVYGLMFAALFYKTGSIWPGIIAHFLQDFTPMFAVDFLRKMQGG
jgi:membrane protease YdiL (CAAX protease family)